MTLLATNLAAANHPHHRRFIFSSQKNPSFSPPIKPTISTTVFRNNFQIRAANHQQNNEQSPTTANTDLPDSTSWWTTWKTLTQLWAIVLPLGYAGVPLAAQILADVPGGPSLAAVAVETTVLISVAALLLRQKNLLNTSFNGILHPKTIVMGAAAAVVALFLNQTVFSSSFFTVIQQSDGSTTTTTTTEAVAALVTSNSPLATAALFTATAVLAPATIFEPNKEKLQSPALVRL